MGVTQTKKAYYLVKEKIVDDEFSARVTIIENEYRIVIEKFIDYCETQKIHIIFSDAELAFISFLKEQDFNILFMNQDIITVLPDANTSTSINNLLGRFITVSYEKDPDLFNHISDLAMGHVILSVAIFRDHSLFQGRLSGLQVYLDIGFLFSISGVDGIYRKKAFRDFLLILIDNEINLNIFRHTYNEFLGIIESCEMNIGKPSFDHYRINNALRFFIENGYTKSDIEIFKAEIPDLLKTFNIEIIDIPIPTRKEEKFQISEETLTKEIIETYKNHNPAFDYDDKKRTIQLDVSSISAIYLLRKGRRPLSVRDAR